MDANKFKITGGIFMSIKKGTMPPRYDETFKSGAIKMVTEQGRPSKEVAAELGICVETLKSWLKRAGFNPVRPTDKIVTTSVSVNLKRKYARFASSLPRKMRSLMY